MSDLPMHVSRSLKIGVLVALHLIAASVTVGLALGDPWAGWWYWQNLPKIAQISVFTSQAVLLATWAVVSRGPVSWRVIGLVVGIAVLEVGCSIHREPVTRVLTRCLVLASLAVAGLLWTGRACGYQLVDFGHAPPKPRREPLRFSIRSLLWLTIAVALAAWGGKALIAAHDDRDLELLLNLGSYFVILGLTALWASLGTGRLWLRMLAVLVLAMGAAGFFWFCVNSGSLEVYYNVTSVILLYVVMLLVSLLIVRACGYRMVRRDDVAAASRGV